MTVDHAETREPRISIDCEQLFEEMSRIPVQPGIGLRLLRMLDDPRVSAETLGRVVERDPSLSARLITMANSSFYGLVEPAANAWRALTVIGLSTVRSIVTAAALDLGAAEGISVPAGFWTHATATAAAAGLLAPRVDANVGDAFSLGLLHDIGSALLFRRFPDEFATIASETSDARPLVIVERELMGVDHGDLSARALASLRFDEASVDAIRAHHHAADLGPMAAVLRAADTLAAVVTGEELPEEQRNLDAALAALSVREHEHAVLLQRVCEIVDELGNVVVG